MIEEINKYIPAIGILGPALIAILILVINARTRAAMDANRELTAKILDKKFNEFEKQFEKDLSIIQKENKAYVDIKLMEHYNYELRQGKKENDSMLLSISELEKDVERLKKEKQ